MLGTDEDVGMRGAVGQKSHRKRNTTEREGRRRLAGLGKAHAANIIVEDDRGCLEEGRAEDPILHAWCTENGQPALVINKAIIQAIAF